MPSSALPLNVTSTTPQRSSRTDANSDSGITPTATTPANGLPKTASESASVPAGEISSPHELTAFVESLLEQLESRFDDMSTQILDRMSQMSSRVDALEASIQDIINSDVSGGNMSPGLPSSGSIPPSPSLSGGPNGLSTPSMRRATSTA